MQAPVPISTTQAALDLLRRTAVRLRYLADNYGGAWPDDDAKETLALADKAEQALNDWHESEDALLEDMAAEQGKLCPLHNCDLESGVCPRCVWERDEKHLLQNDEARGEN